MRPERFLGADPAPGDLQAIDDVTGVLRSCVVALAEGRQRLDHLTGPRSVWQGPHAAAVVRTLSDFSWELRTLEDALAEFTQAWQDWRLGVAQRQDRTAELVDLVTRLDADAAAGRQKEAILERAAMLGEEHARAARETGTAAEALVAAMPAEEGDLAADLNRALTALHEAVEAWVVDAEQQLLHATSSVGAVAELTAAVPGLLGVDGADSTSSAGVQQLATTAPGSHRLQSALDGPRSPIDPELLPVASFATVGDERSALADRLRGRGGDHGRGDEE